ncbi:MAG: TRAP transporter small permease [Lachnospiraceae bacterium]|nr:TRAP transporter small permease [Lachnospiraceae bacterium]
MKIGEMIIGICGIGILISMIFAIIPRTLFGFSFAWPEETSRYLMIWVAFIGSSVAMKRCELVSFEFFVSMFHGKNKFAAALIARAITLYFLVIFLHVGVQMLPSYMKSKAVGLPITLFWPALGLFVGGIFMLVHTIDGGLHDILSLMGKEGA